MHLPGIIAMASTIFAAANTQPQGHIARTIHSAAPDIRLEVIQRAADALACERSKGTIDPKRLAIVDFSLPNTQERMWLIDLEDGKLLSRQLVSHGSGSGAAPTPKRFSNTPGSHASSLGLYKVAEEYRQIRGVPLDAGPSQTKGLDPYPRARLDGLTHGFNHLARPRAVVIHSARYVTPARAGLSQGCFALEKGKTVDTVQWLADGQALYADAPDPGFIKHMQALADNCPGVEQARRELPPGATLDLYFDTSGKLIWEWRHAPPGPFSWTQKSRPQPLD